MVFCSKCGTENNDVSNFCASCGNKLVNTYELKPSAENINQKQIGTQSKFSLKEDIDWILVLPTIPIMVILLFLTQTSNLLIIIVMLLGFGLVGYFSKPSNILYAGLCGGIIGFSSIFIIGLQAGFQSNYEIISLGYVPYSIEHIIGMALFGGVLLGFTPGFIFAVLGKIIRKRT